MSLSKYKNQVKRIVLSKGLSAFQKMNLKNVSGRNCSHILFTAGCIKLQTSYETLNSQNLQVLLPTKHFSI